MKVSIANDSEKREYAAYAVAVTTPEFEKGHDFGSGNASDSALFQFLSHSAEGIGCDSKPCSIVDGEDGNHEYNLKVKSIPNPGEETRRYIYQHDFKADSPEHAQAYAQGIKYALNRVSPLSIHGDPTESAFLEGYRAGEYLSIYLPRDFYMIVKDIDDGWRVSFIVDK